MARKTKTCNFCGKSFDVKDKSVVLFKASTDDSDIRICSNCIKNCSELYEQNIAKQKQKELAAQPLDLTPKDIFEKLNEWILDQDPAIKKISREYYNHLKRLKRYDADNTANQKLRLDKTINNFFLIFTIFILGRF